MRVRQAARLIVLGAGDRVLLFRHPASAAVEPLGPDRAHFWATPGGGLEPGETFVQAAARELWEEAGIADSPIGPWLWVRECEVAVRTDRFLSHERYFLTRATSRAVSAAHRTPEERDDILESRWWSLAELQAGGDVFFPTGLADLLEPVLAGRVPADPIAISG